MKRLHLLAVGAVLSVMAVFAGVALAQEDGTSTIALSVSPQVFEISADPGDSVSESFRIVNGTDVDLTLTATPKNFTPEGEEGGVNLTEDSTSYSLASWISVNPSLVTVPARGSQDFDFVINLPADAEPGSHLGSIIVQTEPVDLDGSGAAVSQEIGPLILASVSGDIVEAAEIASFTTDSFWESGPVALETRVTNKGNVHFKPAGTIEIKNMFGSVVATIDLDEKNVLPDSTRLLTNEWNGVGFTVGRYTADLTLIYGSNNEILTASTSFTVFPYKTIVPVALVVLIAIFLMVRYRGRLSKAGKALSGK